jgi:hypothetical protein
MSYLIHHCQTCGLSRDVEYEEPCSCSSSSEEEENQIPHPSRPLACGVCQGEDVVVNEDLQCEICDYHIEVYNELKYLDPVSVTIHDEIGDELFDFLASKEYLVDVGYIRPHIVVVHPLSEVRV